MRTKPVLSLFAILIFACLMNPSQLRAEVVSAVPDELMAAGGERVCMSQQTFDGVTHTGKIEIHGKLARMDIAVTRADKAQSNFHLIKGKKAFLMWGDGFPRGEGAKLPFGKTNADDLKAMIGEDVIAFECTDTKIDAVRFEPPANVRFNE